MHMMLLLLVLFTIRIQGFLLPDTCLEASSTWSCKCGKSMKADEVGCWDKVVIIVNYTMVGTKWLEKGGTG